MRKRFFVFSRSLCEQLKRARSRSDSWWNPQGNWVSSFEWLFIYLIFFMVTKLGPSCSTKGTNYFVKCVLNESFLLFFLLCRLHKRWDVIVKASPALRGSVLQYLIETVKKKTQRKWEAEKSCLSNIAFQQRSSVLPVTLLLFATHLPRWGRVWWGRPSSPVFVMILCYSKISSLWTTFSFTFSCDNG